MRPGLTPAEGRAPHARMGMLWLHPGMPPLGHRACFHPSVIMPYPGFGFGLTPPGRAETAPLRENRPSRYLRVSPARPSHLGLRPRRGGLCTPTRKAQRQLQRCLLLPTGCSLTLDHHALPGACIRPCHPGAETAPLRENRPSHYPRVFPARPLTQACAPPDERAPHPFSLHDLTLGRPLL